MQEIEIHIGKDFSRYATLLMFMDRAGMVRHVYNFYTGETAVIKEGEAVDNKFIMKIPQDLVRPLFEALAVELDKQGIKTPDTHKIEGTLEATKYHLEDMRKIVFKP